MSVHSRPSQNYRIIEYMQEFGSITQLEALRDLGVMRLASRISDLRKHGYPIIKETVTVRNRYDEPCRIKQYRLKEEEGEMHGRKTDVCENNH